MSATSDIATVLVIAGPLAVVAALVAYRVGRRAPPRALLDEPGAAVEPEVDPVAEDPAAEEEEPALALADLPAQALAALSLGLVLRSFMSLAAAALVIVAFATVARLLPPTGGSALLFLPWFGATASALAVAWGLALDGPLASATRSKGLFLLTPAGTLARIGAHAVCLLPTVGPVAAFLVGCAWSPTAATLCLCASVPVLAWSLSRGSLAPVVVLVEDLGGVAAFRRSSELSRGHGVLFLAVGVAPLLHAGAVVALAAVSSEASFGRAVLGREVLDAACGLLGVAGVAATPAVAALLQVAAYRIVTARPGDAPPRSP